MALVSKTSSVEASKPKPAERMSLQAKSKTVQARDARPAAESIRDFAEFIKSTGPPGPIDPGPLPVPGSPRSSDVTEALKKGNPPSRGNAPKLQARSATAPKDDQTHGLIDFLREGPPAPGGHPIPRVTAPFRDPTDSEASEPERAERVPTRASQASTLGSSMANKSFTSVGSRTGLLDSTRRATAQPGASTNGTTPSEGDAFPARKQSRVRDPYAIDLDDDELDDLLEPQKPKREEESLMDFLRNVPPPDAQPSPQPFNLSSNKMRVPPKSPLRQSPGNSLAGQSNYTVKVGMERNAGSAMPGKQTETSALADFLKNTAPPEPPTPRTVSAGAGKKESGANTLSRLFTRRKKVEV